MEDLFFAGEPHGKEDPVVLDKVAALKYWAPTAMDEIHRHFFENPPAMDA